ncbi:HAD family hydrolase [Dyadobacter chenhuakuii]|uniref:Cof-type HAD-IIB family hydrolase n=1 Tax=Dyadobacter chenhuakuii TaxID=2909339 RepID=A0ABY4XKH6_9BACT|nr:HAD family hydrolase [Dyadobacter chenhuakuii]MCF2493614.1 Cof-type HAD-IIB family hydrolase [Dyadobacter chenhuakuii]USJ30751.1 Cof-type HAD-IIB family hydrolase [Dyadobacter chenhuakuii]
MTFSDIRLVATDMDGTLLNSKHEIHESFFPVFRKLRDNGVIFVAASGRQYFNLAKALEQVKDEVIFAAENGSYVVFKDEEIHIQPIEADIVRELVQISRPIKDTYAVICGKKKAYVENDEPEFINHLKLYFERYEIVEDLTKVEDDQFLKFTLCDLAGSEVNSYPHYKHFEDNLQVKISGPIWLDISHKKANKGRAMEVLQEKFNITFDQTMIFGDYLNDLEMLTKGHYSYAMANAHPDIKKIARFIAKSNDENGVVEVLSEITD